MGTVSDPVQLPLGNYDVTVSDSASGDVLWQSDDEVLDFGFNDLFMLTDNAGPSVASERPFDSRVWREYYVVCERPTCQPTVSRT